MSVLIKGMEMPKEGFVEILIRDDGTVQQTGQSYRIDGTDYYTPYVGEMPTMFEAVEVPSHGRLIDADALLNAIKKAGEDDSEIADVYKEDYAAVSDWLYTAPTVIPADKDGEA